MDWVRIGIGLDIAGPIIMLILIIVGAVKAWPYRKSDRQKFIAIYKPYKYWGLCLWMICNIVGIAITLHA